MQILQINECFDFACPASHPVHLPEIHLYVRVRGYEGGAHVFSNDSDVSRHWNLHEIFLFVLKIFHSDYFSGWDEEQMQYLLDECENYSEAAMPDAFCSDYLTFRGHGKEEGVQYDDDDIVRWLGEIQPDPVDTQGTISPEQVGLTCGYSFTGLWTGDQHPRPAAWRVFRHSHPSGVSHFSRVTRTNK